MEINGMQFYKALHQHYGIIDMPLSGGFSHWGKLVFLCLGDMASGQNVHCNLMLHPSGSPSFPPRPSPTLFFQPSFSPRRWVLRSHLVSADICPNDSDPTRRSQQWPVSRLMADTGIQSIPVKMSWNVHTHSGHWSFGSLADLHVIYK